MTSINQKFAEEIRAQLARKQLTSKDLAPVMGVSASHASRLVNGERTWTLEQAYKAASWVGVEVSQFIDWTPAA